MSQFAFEKNDPIIRVGPEDTGRPKGQGLSEKRIGQKYQALNHPTQMT